MSKLGIRASGYMESVVSKSIAVTGIASPFIFVYPWSAGFGTKYANPATLPYGGNGAATAFSP